MSWRKDRQHYYALKAAGKCVACGCMKGRGVTTVRCASYNEKRNDVRNAQRRMWHSIGLCRTCGDPVKDGHTRCPQCLWDKNHSRSEPIVEKKKAGSGKQEGSAGKMAENRAVYCPGCSAARHGRLADRAGDGASKDYPALYGLQKEKTARGHAPLTNS